MRRIPAIFLSLFLILISISSLAQQPYGQPISLAKAKQAATKAAEEARKNNFKMAIAIVDTSGTLVYFEKIDDTRIGSVDVALAKAKSANNFKRSTKEFEDMVAKGSVQLLGLPGAVPIGGGQPLLMQGNVVGAVGVSGGTAAEDDQVASAAVRALAE